MTSPPRKPMTFAVPPTTALPLAEPAKLAAPPKPAPDAVERQQVGARVPASVYRELKARAALSGVTVQTLVEQAIVEFLAKG